MRIVVEYCYGNIDFVDPARLDILITSRKITGFKRADRWVRVPQGPLRGHGGKKYEGPERRKKDALTPCKESFFSILDQGRGFEPRFSDSESEVLPLDDP